MEESHVKKRTLLRFKPLRLICAAIIMGYASVLSRNQRVVQRKGIIRQEKTKGKKKGVTQKNKNFNKNKNIYL